mgnify:CR=1 FL=1
MPEEEIKIEIEEERKGTLFGPEGILMISLAIMIDLAGLVEFIPVVGNVISFIADLVGIIFIGGWMFFRSQQVTVTKRAVTRMTRLLRWLRPLAFIGEFIPFVGILPLWTIVVYFELQQ